MTQTSSRNSHRSQGWQLAGVRWLKWLVLFGSSAIALPAIASSLTSSTGESGINAQRLHAEPYNLTGAKIGLGQVEIGRPGLFGLDKVVPGMPVVSVSRVFFRDSRPDANQGVDSHAAHVAGVMISDDKMLVGVAPGARLYSAAVGSLRRSGQPEECLSSQHVAMQNGGDVRAINFSFGEPLYRDPRSDAVLDGNALLTQCIDWSSRVHDVLYVIAGNQGRGGIPIPTDNYNGLNVAYSARVNGVFNKVDFANLGSEPDPVLTQAPRSESNVGARRSIGIVAPGNQIELIDADGSVRVASGSSFAAPHVAATVALIQEYGDRQLASQIPGWTLDAREPQVSKAVLMNSANKLEDTGDGLNLGMDRTVRTERNRDWTVSDAFRDSRIPLHDELGTGQLDAFRAYEQFSAGQWSSDTPVPVRGWDYSTVGLEADTAEYQDYEIEVPLQANSYFSATLTWDRLVELQDDNNNGLYDLGETFRDRGLNNLDLYLMRAEDDDIDDAVWASNSSVDSAEHIFFQVPETGRYKLRVVYSTRLNDSTQDYALAWWGATEGARDETVEEGTVEEGTVEEEIIEEETIEE
ncbi:MAG: S8 family serine peptidase [Thainema sp.]